MLFVIISRKSTTNYRGISFYRGKNMSKKEIQKSIQNVRSTLEKNRRFGSFFLQPTTLTLLNDKLPFDYEEIAEWKPKKRPARNIYDTDSWDLRYIASFKFKNMRYNIVQDTNTNEFFILTSFGRVIKIINDITVDELIEHIKEFNMFRLEGE